MILEPPPARDGDDDVRDALSRLGTLDWTQTSAPPVLLAYYPASPGNPFQDLLYGSLPETNAIASPVADPATATLLATSLAPRPDAPTAPAPRVVLHLHWLNKVMAKATDAEQAQHAMDRFTDELDRFLAAGGLLMWTVHNVLPHDAAFPGLEAELRQRVADRCSVVHVMAPSTAEQVAPWFHWDADRTFELPHPSYAGAYPQVQTRAVARAGLGIGEHTFVFVLFGRLAPYKGLTELADAIDALSDERPGEVLLVVAGPVVAHPETDAFMASAAAHPAMLVVDRRVPVEEVQTYLGAADAAVLPYRRSLNSGALNLAQTFGLPAVIAESSGEAATSASKACLVYDDADPGALLEALRRATTELRDPEARVAASAAAAAKDPTVIARAFATHVRSVIDQDATA